MSNGNVRGGNRIMQVIITTIIATIAICILISLASKVRENGYGDKQEL